MSAKTLRLIFFIGILVSLLTACANPAAGDNTPLPSPFATHTSGGAVPTPTPTKQTTLTICLGQEPNTLYPYANPNNAARRVMSAIYDGPVDVFMNGVQPVILKELPSLDNGDAQLVPVKVKQGSPVMDTRGVPVILAAGMSVYPAGCNDDACAVRYGGQGEIEMDQLIVTFRMRSGLTWSDGTPLTSADSVYSYGLAAAAAAPNYLVERTQSYEMVDELTTQWWGKPGFIDPAYVDNFWSPLPKHAWGNLTPEELPNATLDARPALGWGAYQFEEWAAGESIRLSRNPSYFRAAEGLPAFDTLVFRFLRDAESGISALAAGECDLLDTSLRLESQIALLVELESREQIKSIVTQTTIIERLDFGILPAAYDDGINPSDRPNWFADLRTRQGLAYCLDRQSAVKTVLAGYSVVPASFLLPAHPLNSETVSEYPFDPSKGAELLSQAGWTDTDNNPSTPRVSTTVAGLPVGTPLQLRYVTTEAIQRRQVAEILAKGLAECGLGLQVEYVPANEVYAPGPGGPLFGRSFDLAAYAVGPASGEFPCSWFSSDQIPSAENNWIGLNISGYTNPDYDALCRKAMRILPDQPGYGDAHAQVQQIFANDLPVVPLYVHIKAAAARRDLCNFSLEAAALSELWNIEELDIDPACTEN